MNLLVFFPIFTATFGLVYLFTLLGIWLNNDHHIMYRQNEPTIVYISDIGAVHKTLFIILSSILAVLYLVTKIILTIVNKFLYEIVFGITTSSFLILLSVFDAFDHEQLHFIFAFLFFISTLLNILVDCIKLRKLNGSFNKNIIFKLFLLIFGILFFILFIVLHSYCSNCIANSVSAILEWLLVLVFIIYIYSLAFDIITE